MRHKAESRSEAGAVVAPAKEAGLAEPTVGILGEEARAWGNVEGVLVRGDRCSIKDEVELVAREVAEVGAPIGDRGHAALGQVEDDAHPRATQIERALGFESASGTGAERAERTRSSGGVGGAGEWHEGDPLCLGRP